MSIRKYFHSVSLNQEIPEVQGPDLVHDLSPPSASDVTELISQDLSTVSGDGIEDICRDDDSDCVPPTPKQPHLNNFPEDHDLARYAGAAVCISDAEKYDLLINPF